MTEVASLRFSRDKRGYEHFYIVQSATRRGKSRSRVLYWFRTPPNMKMGREPFDEALRRALEAQNPDVTFDWQKMLDTPIPPPVEPERWRERRKAERAAKLEARAEAAAEVEAEERVANEAAADEAVSVDSGEPTPSTGSVSDAPATAQSPSGRRRRRRRGRRGHVHEPVERPEPAELREPREPLVDRDDEV